MTDIFVFGSNLAGLHGGGAAFHALEHHGAILGQGIGLQGQSYATPTMDENLYPLPLGEIARHIANFLDFARSRPDLTFYVTPVGCGIAGYSQPQIRPFLTGMPPNCRFAETWSVS